MKSNSNNSEEVHNGMKLPTDNCKNRITVKKKKIYLKTLKNVQKATQHSLISKFSLRNENNCSFVTFWCESTP